MKTANTIEQQESRKETEKNGNPRRRAVAQNSDSVSEGRQRSLANLAPHRFQPGKSGNPGGKPKVDLSAQIAIALFENDGPAIYDAYRRVLRKGSAYAFQVLSDRAFGKLKESHQLEVGQYQECNMTEEQLERRIAELDDQIGMTELRNRLAELERQLGISKQAPALPPGNDLKPN